MNYQIKPEELLTYCKEYGLDENSLRYTEPEYYIDNVQIDTYDNEKIKDMIRSVDQKAAL